VREIERDGLTPSIDLVRAIQAEVRLPLRVMVRDSDGFTIKRPEELRSLQRTFGILADLEVHGAVVGFARDGRLDLDAIHAVLSAAPHLPVTLHRAFDSVHDPFAAIDEALTSKRCASGAIRSFTEKLFKAAAPRHGTEQRTTR